MKRVSGRSGIGAKVKILDLSGKTNIEIEEMLSLDYNIITIDKFFIKVFPGIKVRIYEYKIENLLSCVNIWSDNRFVGKFKDIGMEFSELIILIKYIAKINKLALFI